jgi:hypothetical protein
MFFLFGKKKVKTNKKPPSALIKRARKYKVKVTTKRGGRRVYKSVAAIKKEIKKKMKRKLKRKARFGNASPFIKPDKFGYNQPVKQNFGILDQSSSIVTARSNIERPDGFKLPVENTPTFGTYAPFFGSQVPKTIPPNWNFMGQPDGSLYAVGSPFMGYKTPAGKSAFGKVRRRRCNCPRCR